MWKAALLLCTALAITACGKSSPTAPTAESESVKPAPAGGLKSPASDAPAPSRRKSDDHVEPPGVLPPG